MEKREFPMHIRITDKTYIPLWRDEGIGVRFIWKALIACSFILLMIFAVILSIIIQQNPPSLIGIVVIITIMVCMAFLLGIMLRGRHVPNQYGVVTLGEDVRISDPVNQPTRRRCSYNDVSILHIGRCPDLFCRWRSYGMTGSWVDEKDIKRMSRHYGEHYIVARDENHIALFALTYNEDAWRILLQRCPSAIVFLSQQEYDDARMAKKRRADAFEEEMTEKSGVQDFGGYVN